MQRISWIVGVLALVSLSGVVELSVRAEEPAAPTRVVDHVTYLASPELKGRKPMTRGSKKARAYIADHFTSLGLVPWGTAEGFEQSVLIGTNVVGVLPGGDPALKDEIVLISAHYDHLGKGHLGAADNAAGVAALLELASRLATAPESPKRSIAFAAFDCEERGLWGSVCFSVREDFDAQRIAANINIDMLGRKAFDVVENTLFMAASHELPPVDAAVDASPVIEVLPIPSHLAAARSDHAVFESLGIPALFFSSGLYRDYHQKEDTLENLDVGLLARSTDVLFASALAAVNAPALGPRVIPMEGTDAMLASVARVQKSILENAAGFVLDGETLEACRVLHADTEAHLLGESCDRGEHNALVTRGVLTLGPVMLGYQDAILRDEHDEHQEAQGDREKALRRNRQTAASLFLMAQHGKAYFELYRDYARQVLSRSSLSLVTVGLPTYSETRFPLREIDYRLEVNSDENCRLAAVVPRVSFQIRPRRFARMLPSGSLSASFEYLEFDGSREELIDYLLFKWRQRQHTEEWGAIYAKFLREVAGEPVPSKYEECLAWRMAQLGVKEEAAWLERLRHSDRCDILGPLINVPESILVERETLIRIARSSDLCPSVRALALSWYVNINFDDGTFSATPEMLANLIVLADDPTIAVHRDEHADWESISILGLLMRTLTEEPVPLSEDGDAPPPSIGALTCLRLKELTGETEIADSRAAWQAWLDAKLVSHSGGAFLPVVRELSMRDGRMAMTKTPGGRYGLGFEHGLSGSAHATLWQEGAQSGQRLPRSMFGSPGPGMRASRR